MLMGPCALSHPWLVAGNIQQYTERSEATAGDIVDSGKHPITKDMVRVYNTLINCIPSQFRQHAYTLSITASWNYLMLTRCV